MLVSIIKRSVVVTVALIILVGAIISLVVATEISPPDFLPYGWFQSPLQDVADATGKQATGIIVISVVITLGMTGVLVFALRFRKETSFIIGSDEKGITTINESSIRLLAETMGATFRSIDDIKCSVAENTGRLVFSCKVSVAIGNDAAQVGSELQTKIKEVVERFTGLRVARINIKVKYKSGESAQLKVR